MFPGFANGLRFINALGGGGAGNDPYFSNVMLLAAFDGADGATSAADDSNSARTLTFVGNAQIDTAQSKFGGASLLLDGTGDRVTVPDSADWQFDGQFTIEMWARWNTLPVVACLCGHATGAIAYGWFINSNNGGALRFRFDDSGNASPEHDISVASGISTGQWYHIAVDRDASNTLRLYRNGVMVASKAGATGTSFNSTGALCIGSAGSDFPFNGWIDEFRLTKGVARYASDSGFTVPTEAFPRS